eukprot:scaffold32182_cov112-Isochrysis_galbana.AAC.1
MRGGWVGGAEARVEKPLMQHALGRVQRPSHKLRRAEPIHLTVDGRELPSVLKQRAAGESRWGRVLEQRAGKRKGGARGYSSPRYWSREGRGIPASCVLVEDWQGRPVST